MGSSCLVRTSVVLRTVQYSNSGVPRTAGGSAGFTGTLTCHLVLGTSVVAEYFYDTGLCQE